MCQILQVPQVAPAPLVVARPALQQETGGHLEAPQQPPTAQQAVGGHLEHIQQVASTTFTLMQVQEQVHSCQVEPKELSRQLHCAT